VLVNGTTVPQDTRKGHEDLQPPFTTYYEQIDGKYWFPTYTIANDTLQFKEGPQRMRMTVKYEDYKQFKSDSVIKYSDVEEPGKTTPPQTPPKKP
jgi:archaellum component FlaF (FlaF/FlaG flagellin family)